MKKNKNTKVLLMDFYEIYFIFRSFIGIELEKYEYGLFNNC